MQFKKDIPAFQVALNQNAYFTECIFYSSRLLRNDTLIDILADLNRFGRIHF